MAVLRATGKERKVKGANWEKTIIQELPEWFLEASSLLIPQGDVHLVRKLAGRGSWRL